MTFDASDYDTVPQTDVAETLALTHALLAAGKAVAAALPAAKKAQKRLRTSGEALQLGFNAPTISKPESAKKIADTETDRAFGGFEKRLAACFVLEGKDGDDARALHAALFPNRLTFLKLKYRKQWSEGEAFLARLGAEGVEARVTELVGAKFVALVRARQRTYGEVLGITKGVEEETEVAKLTELLRATRADLGKYARAVASAAENEDLDETLAEQALRPIATLRADLRSGKKRAEGPSSPEEISPLSGEPLPEVD
jgi:DNA-binding FrmR family transcriptional regulator